jgi:hypothetical protein
LQPWCAMQCAASQCISGGDPFEVHSIAIESADSQIPLIIRLLPLRRLCHERIPGAEFL